MNKKARLPLLLAVPVLAVSGSAALASASVAHTAATHIVKLQNIMISPMTVKVHAGDRVTWEFLDGPSTEHTVTSEAKRGGLRFKSTGAHFSGTYSVKFTKKGTYYYECTIHPGMQGKVVVS
jgi:plastocyanin